MKRFHLHVGVSDLAQSIQFYQTLFGAQPSVVKDDYAKWMLEDPLVNFAISQRGSVGLDHVGMQVDSGAELGELAGRLNAAGETTFDQTAATCCYAKSDKSWVTDPSGVRWETFFTSGEAATYGEHPQPAAASASACCGASARQAAPACC